MKSQTQRGSAHVVTIIILVAALVGALGWIFWQNFIDDSTASTQQTSQSSSEQKPTKDEKLESYTIDNEGLTFDYNAEQSVVKSTPGQRNEDAGIYVVRTKVTTGDAELSIISGIDGIGMASVCIPGGTEKCKVVDSKTGTYLGKPITYRLIETKQTGECGYSGAPSCDKAPQITLYLIDVSKDNEPFRSCCSPITSKSKNLEGKAKVAGSTLVSIVPSKAITNSSLLENADVLKTIKIIESMRYQSE